MFFKFLNNKSSSTLVIITVLLLVIITLMVVGYLNLNQKPLFLTIEDNSFEDNSFEILSLNKNKLYIQSNSNSEIYNLKIKSEDLICNVINNDSLVGFWKLNEDSNFVIDYSKFENHGNVFGNVSFTKNTIFGSGFEFETQDPFGPILNKIEIPYSDSIDITGDEITIIAWVKLRNCPPAGIYYMILKHMRTSPISGGYQMEINGNLDCTLRFGYRNINNTGNRFSSGIGTKLEPERWYFLATGKNLTTIWTLIDGEYDLLDSKETINAIAPNPQPLIIGSQVSTGSGGTTINGTIDRVRLYNRSLSIEEIRNIYKLELAMVNTEIIELDLSYCQLQKNKTYNVSLVTSNGIIDKKELIPINN